MLIESSSLAVAVILLTSDTASDKNFLNTTFPFQCMNRVHCYISLNTFSFHINKLPEVKMNAPSECSDVFPGEQVVPSLLHCTLHYPADSGP